VDFRILQANHHSNQQNAQANQEQKEKTERETGDGREMKRRLLEAETYVYLPQMMACAK
jgi:hypothetical protein